MKWRLSEGSGEAYYELGVSDSGKLIGMTVEEMNMSIETLRKMAHALDAEISVLRVRQVPSLARQQEDNDRDKRIYRSMLKTHNRYDLLEMPESEKFDSVPLFSLLMSTKVVMPVFVPAVMPWLNV